jgi:hypothetical protein
LVLVEAALPCLADARELLTIACPSRHQPNDQRNDDDNANESDPKSDNGLGIIAANHG